MWTITLKQNFSAAHFLKEYKGKCEELHGHNYLIVVHISSKKLPKSGMVYDFREIKDYLKQILPDHKCLNNVYKFNPTTENLAKYFFEVIRKKYPVKKVEIWENEQQGSTYSA
ncbi:MAG: 6-carboxytetrahydropterin synthase QueD [Candidatus Latescibacteria bacterium]|nr:6-carboxytetrahydropterin synthase QueD [Candidatus Latescibacterota bacterium]